MQWIKGYEGRYKVDESGNVFSVARGRNIKPTSDRYGYKYVVLSVCGRRKTMKVHRLVAEAYIPNPDGKQTVDHINNIKDDNRVENLRWATASEQKFNEITHKKIVERYNRDYMRTMAQKRNFGRRKTIVEKDGNVVGEYESLMTAAESVGANYTKASEVANGKRKKSGGYTFRFEDYMNKPEGDYND